jgi:transcriptional regulator with XRE-family HTH domain
MAPPVQGAGGIDKRLQAARKRLGLTREELAVRSGLSWSAIAQIESARRTNLRPATLSALAQALDVTVDYLLDGGPAPPVMAHHSALPYAGEEAFAAAAIPIVVQGLQRDEAVLVVTSKPNQRALRRALGREAGRAQIADSARWYRTPRDALASGQGFLEESLAHGAAWVRVIAEPVWGGRSRAEVLAWTRYEALINLRFGQAPATIVCPYDTGSLSPSILRQMHLTHPQMISDGAVHESPEYVDPGQFIVS